MAVNVLIVDRKVFNTYANGNDYSLNTSDYATYLRGGVMNVQKAVYTVEVSWREKFSTTSGIEYFIRDNKITRNNGSFINEGFSIGDVITFVGLYPVSVSLANRTITNITDTLIIFDGAVEPSVIYTAGLLIGGINDLFALEYSFGIINNNDIASFTSLLDNSEQTYYANNIGVDSGAGRSTSFVNLLPKTNTILGWDSSRNGKSRVRFVSRDANVQTFEIEHEYIINPTNDANLLSQNNSFKYVCKFDFRTNLANLNTSKITIDDLQLGSVGWFNENFDGYNNDFSLSNLVYTDVASLSTVSELNISSKTRVEFTIDSNNGVFSSGDPFVIYHSYLPEFNVYDNSPLSYRETWAFDSFSSLIGSSPAIGGMFSNIEAILVNANQITVSFEIELPPSQAIRLSEGFSYDIAIEVGNGDTANQPDNVTLLIDNNTYDKDENVTDLIISDKFGFNPYYKFISPTDDLFTTYKGWIEDEIVSFHRFGVNRTVTKDAVILAGRFKIVAYEDATGETFDLQNEELDLSNQLNAPTGTINSNPFDIQLINDDRKRGYNLPNGDEFNLLLFETSDNDGTYQFYEWRVGFKMNWQYWVALSDADNVFINTNDTFNGKNNRASNYSLKNGWSIRTVWQFEMQGINDEGSIAETEYNFTTDKHNIFDFGEQDNDPTEWGCEIFTTDDFGNDLGGMILNGENTFIKSVFTPTSPFIIADILPYWGEIRIAEENQQGFNNDVLSTTKPYLIDNRIIPLDGENFAKITLINNTIEIYCKVNYSKINENVNYKLSSRLANQDVPIAQIEFVFSTEIDVNPPTSTEIFDPSVLIVGGETVTWNLINGYSETTNTLIKSDRNGLHANELNGTCQDVKMTFSTNNPNNIRRLDLNNDFICSNIDLGIFGNMRDLFVQGNPKINEIINFSLTSSWEQINFSSCNILGVFDLTNLNFSSDLRLRGNGNINLTDIDFTSAFGVIVFLQFVGCNLTGILDLKDVEFKGSEFRLDNNPLLTNINIQTISENSSNNFRINDCNITGNLDLTNFRLTQRFILFNNPLLTSISHSSFLNTTIEYYAYSCGLVGVHDLTKVRTRLRLKISFNPLLTNVLFRNNTTGDTITELFINNCGISTYIDLTPLAFYTSINDSFTRLNDNSISNPADINHILVDLDTNSIGGFTNRLIYLDGGTMAAPDSTSGGFNGIAARLSLVAKGFNVNIN